ncbi:MAG TPA: O-antigen ligase family protein [Roseiarcus sp.]|nr:O-antigen ligase family protein [Roseiarcus sp.]
MATRIGNRFALSQIASVAMAETRLAGRAIPNVLRYLAPIVAWTVASIALGIVLGFSAVILPPMGAFGIVAVAGLVLLWVMPDLPLVSPGIIRKAFFFMLIADLIIPFYYTVQFSGLPWISARRLATFTLIAPFLVAVAASSEVRWHIAERVRASLLLFICAAGFLAVATLSVLTSTSPTQSTSALVDAVLSWYVPFFAMIYIAKDKTDVVFLLKIICLCAIFNTGAGVVEFFLKHRFFVDIFPKGMFATMIENNPTLANLLPNPQDFRNGLFRASSTFVTPLSFGEFQIIVIPIGLFFLLHRETLFERLLGGAVAFGGIVGIFCSGSRGGFVGVIASVAVFVTFYSIRKAVSSKGSLVPAIAGLIGIIGFGCVIGVIILSHQMHDMVLGGAAQASSTNARYIQWAAGTPFIKSNPITGHGFGLGGLILGLGQIDSYVLSLVVETGIPGLVFFVGLLVLPVWYGLRNYLSDMSESGALAGALACSFIGFIMNRLVLSQKENHMLIFSLLAIVIVLNNELVRKRAPQLPGDKSPRNTYHRAGSVSPGQRTRQTNQAGVN